MRFRLFGIGALGIAVVLTLLNLAGRGKTEVNCPGTDPLKESPHLPYARYQDLPWMRVKDWCRRFEANLSRPGRADAQVVFLGDSITEGWMDDGAEVWKQHIARYSPLALAIPGDETQQVLWRIENGELDGLSPRALVLLIGVNNLRNGSWSPQDTAGGIKAVLQAIQRKLPRTRILLMGLFPAMEHPDHDLRKAILATNALLKMLDGPGVRFLDIGERFLLADGRISSEVMDDHLHLTREGYLRWARMLDGSLNEIMTL